MNSPTIYSLVSEIARAYNELIALLPQVAAHTKKFQFALSQFHQFLQSFSHTATMAPLTQAHVESFKMILKYKQDYQKLLSAHFIQCWAYSVLEQSSDYVPTTLCQIATGLQEATMDLDPVGARAFDSSAPQWLQYHILDLKAIDASLEQYRTNPNADPNVLKAVDTKLESIHKFVLQYEGKCVQTGGIVFSPIPIVYQGWRLLYTDFEIGQEIGQGVSAHVYTGVMKKTGEKVAIKVLKFKKLEGQQLSAFQRELSILASANHECLLRFVGATDAPPFCIVTEWMPGSTLYADFTKNHLLDVTDRSIAIFDIARGMKFLHSRHIIHRDLKSLNVLINGNKRVKICDFGLSRFTDGNGAMTNNIGTPHWMAPELLQPDGEYDFKVDVYAYAIMLWEICTCKIPYQGLIGAQIIARVLVSDLRPPLPANASPALKQLMKDCWQRDPSLRPTFSEIVTRIQKGDIYIEGTNVDVIKKYYDDIIRKETTELLEEIDDIINKNDYEKLSEFIDQNGIPGDKIDACWEVTSKIEDSEKKAKTLIPFLKTTHRQQAANSLRVMPHSVFTEKDIQRILSNFPSGDEEADRSLFIYACKNNKAAVVLPRAVSEQHIKLGLEVISRQGADEASVNAITDIATKCLSHSDAMLVASAIRCLARFKKLDTIPMHILQKSLKSPEATLSAVATSAIAKISVNRPITGDLLEDLLYIADSNPLAILAIVNGCSNLSTATEIATKNISARLSPTTTATILVRAARHPNIRKIIKPQLEKVVMLIQDIDMVKTVRATIDSM